MTMTETRPRDDAGHDEPAPPDVPTAPTREGGLLGLFGSGDPSVLGRLWIGTALLFLLGSALLGTLIQVEGLKVDTADLFSVKAYPYAFSLQWVAAVFLAAIPLFIGVATIVVPRQLGTRTVAFPRAAAAAYWAYALGGGMVVLSYLIKGGPFGSNEKAVDLFLASLAMVCVALILASVTLATTVVGYRPPGMWLHRVPAFSWSILVAATLWIANLAVVGGLLVLLYVDHRYRAFNLTGPGDIDKWLTVARTQPMVYAIGIPVLGFAADVVPVLTGRRLSRHGVVIGGIGAMGALSFGGWAVAQVINPDVNHELLYVAMGIAVAFPALLVLGGVLECLAKGRPRFAPPLLFALLSLLLFVAAVIAGAVRVVHPFHLVGTTADTSVMVLVVAAAVIAAIGAVHWWWPQILGQAPRTLLGSLAALAFFVGGGLWGVALLVAGFLDEPFVQQGIGYAPRDGVEALNGVAMVGAALFTLGVLVFVANVLGTLSRDQDAEIPADPWDGATLEWAPDPAAVPVASPTPLLDQKEAGA